MTDTTAASEPRTLCRTCVTPIAYIDAPTGGWWAHDTHPADEHDAVPGAWVDGDELMEAIAAAVWEHCGTEGTSLVVDDPRNIAGTAAAVARRMFVAPIALPARWECSHGPADDEPYCAEGDSHVCPTIRVHPDDAPAFAALIEQVHRQQAELASERERFKAGLRRADEHVNAMSEELKRYADGKETPVLWSVYNAMHLRAATAESLIATVRATHKPRTERHGSGCVQCGIVWPCPTYRALEVQPAAAEPSDAAR